MNWSGEVANSASNTEDDNANHEYDITIKLD